MSRLPHGTWQQTGGGGPSGVPAWVYAAGLLLLVASAGRVAAAVASAVAVILWTAAGLGVLSLTAGIGWVIYRHRHPSPLPLRQAPPVWQDNLAGREDPQPRPETTGADSQPVTPHYHLHLPEGADPAAWAAALRQADAPVQVERPAR
jgi:hypothetical protein